MLTKSVEEMKQLLDEIYRDSVNTRMQGQTVGYQTSLPTRPFTIPVRPNNPRLPNASPGPAGLRHMRGYAYGSVPFQEHVYSLRLGNVCAKIRNCGMIPGYPSDRTLNQDLTEWQSGIPVCEAVLTESYKMLK